MKKVLLFGAYANGNLGDALQARSLARHVKRNNKEIACWSVSPARARLFYDFDPGRRLSDPDAAWTEAGSDHYAAVLIGGGGLLASPHRPLNDEQWVESIKAPIFLISIGASPELVEQHVPLIRKASVVTARDEFSLRALRTIRSDVSLLPDPVLADRLLDRLPEDGDGSVCVIPRRMDEENIAIYRQLANTLIDRDYIFSMFPNADQETGLSKTFPDFRTTHVRTWFTADRTLGRPSVVLSDRFHGCILALKRGLSCVGLGAAPGRKIESLYSAIGLQKLVLTPNAEIGNRHEIIDFVRSEFDLGLVSAFVGAAEDKFDAEFSKILSTI